MSKVKTTKPICHSQRWKRAAAARSFKLVRTVSTFLPPPFTANELIKLEHKNRRSTQTSALHFSPPPPSPQVPGDSPCSWCVRHRCSISFLFLFFQSWPWSIVVSNACGKCVFSIRTEKSGHCSPSGNKWLTPHFNFSVIFKVSSIVVIWVWFSFSLVLKFTMELLGQYLLSTYLHIVITGILR